LLQQTKKCAIEENPFFVFFFFFLLLIWHHPFELLSNTCKSSALSTFESLSNILQSSSKDFVVLNLLQKLSSLLKSAVKTSLLWFCCEELLSSGFAWENFSPLDLLVRTSSLFWILLWELLSSGFCCKNCFSFGEASTNITYLSSAKSFLNKHVCMLHTSSLQASSFKSSRSFGSDDIPDNFASSSSSLHQKLSQSPLLSRFRSKHNNKTPTQSPVATNNVHCTWTLSLSSRVPLSLSFSLSEFARELIAEVVQEDVEKSVDKGNEFPSTLFSQIAEKADRRKSCKRRRPGVRQQEKRGFLQPIHNSHCCC